MKRLIFIALSVLCIIIVPVFSCAENYQVTVTRKDSNVYKVTGADIFIITRYCYEYVYSEDSILKIDGGEGKIIFIDKGSSCDVKGVYEKTTQAIGTYLVTVSREADNWYEISWSDLYVKTTLCLDLSLGSESILKINVFGSGTIIFDDNNTCDIEGIYSRIRK